MKKYKCSICNQIIDKDSIDEISSCPYCGVDISLINEVEETKEEYKEIEGPIPIDSDNPSIERIDEKCIKCGLCSKICQNSVGIKYIKEKSKCAVCINCGQCIINCPTKAIVPKYCYKKVLEFIKDPKKTVVCYTSPSVRVSIGDEFDMKPGENVEGKIVTALKDVGFDYVFDTTFGADLTIMEEASELINRIKNKKNLPQFTSCCPAWVKYTEIYHPELINNLSSCKSPIGMQGAIIKNYFSELKGISKDDIITVALTPCVAKKTEISRKEIDGTDYVITATEFAKMLKELNIDLAKLKDTKYDDIMGRGSGAGVIFGNSGGVMEAALRCAYKFITNLDPPEKLLEYKDVRGYNNLKEAKLTINDLDINILVCHGLLNIEKIIQSKDYEKYDFIEVMNCPGGCVGGGGQPLKNISNQQEIIEARINKLYEEDRQIDVKVCYNNKDIIDIYESYLEKPLSEKSIKLLHTKYEDKSSILGE